MAIGRILMTISIGSPVRTPSAKESRREKSRVSMAWEGYWSRYGKYNDFNENGLFSMVPWKTTLKNAEVAYFPIYHLRHVFCTRLSRVAPDTVVQRAMRHSSPETKRHYQLGGASATEP